MATDDDQWIKLFRYPDDCFGKVDGQFEEKNEFCQFQTSVDGLAKRIVDDDEEHLAMTSQLKRHDEWLHQLAKKLGVSLG